MKGDKAINVFQMKSVAYMVLIPIYTNWEWLFLVIGVGEYLVSHISSDLSVFQILTIMDRFTREI